MKATKQFGELFKFLPKSKIKAGDGTLDGKYPFYTSSNILSKSCDDYTYEGESLIFGTGGSASVHFQEGKFASSTDCFVVQPSIKAVLAKYVYYFLFSNIHILERGFKGAGLKHISKGYIQKLKIPIPYQDNPSKSIAEQKRIGAILDKADVIRKKRHHAIDELNNLIPAIFYDMFGDPVANSKNWPLVSLDDYGEVITGNTPSRQHPDYYGDAIEWIKSDNINTPFHFLTEATEKLSETGKEVGRVAPKSSTLVTCIAGSPSCIGNAAMADREVAFNQQINAICPSKETDEFFLYYIVVMIKKLIQRASTASMKGLVSKSSFSAIKTIKIPLDMQFEFGKKMRKLIQSNLLLNQTASEANDLFNSLVQRAFKGEL